MSKDNFTCEEQHGEMASGNIYLRPAVLNHKGDKIHGHEHHFDHTTFIVAGKVHVIATHGDERKEGEFVAGQHFLVLAEWEHEITALEDNTRFTCIYSHRDPQGEVVQVMTGWEGSIMPHAYDALPQ